MKTDRAITELRALITEAQNPEIQVDSPEHKRWKQKTLAVLHQSLGKGNTSVHRFENLHFRIGIHGNGSAQEKAEDARYFASKLKDAVAILEAAVYELELSVDDETDSGAWDVELWQHVRHNVEEERWDQVASAAVIFLEDKIRRWAEDPVGKDGKKLFGDVLFVKALGQGGPLALGSQSNETDGWRNLGLGMVAAISNVDRHGIQQRDDAKQYSFGVLGLVSLPLTQIKFEHASAIGTA